MSDVRATSDTNVWVSGVLNRRGGPAQIRAAFRAGQFVAVTSEPLLAELKERVTTLVAPQEAAASGRGAKPWRMAQTAA